MPNDLPNSHHLCRPTSTTASISSFGISDESRSMGACEPLASVPCTLHNKLKCQNIKVLFFVNNTTCCLTWLPAELSTGCGKEFVLTSCSTDSHVYLEICSAHVYRHIQLTSRRWMPFTSLERIICTSIHSTINNIISVPSHILSVSQPRHYDRWNSGLQRVYQ